MLSLLTSHDAKPHHVSPMVAYAFSPSLSSSLSLESTIKYPYKIVGCLLCSPSSPRVLPLLHFPCNFSLWSPELHPSRRGLGRERDSSSQCPCLCSDKCLGPCRACEHLLWSLTPPKGHFGPPARSWIPVEMSEVGQILEIILPPEHKLWLLGSSLKFISLAHYTAVILVGIVSCGGDKT